MKTVRALLAGCLLFPLIGQAQRACYSHTYQQQLIVDNPEIANSTTAIDNYTRNYLENNQARDHGGTVIIIPVVVHILYHTPSEYDAVTNEEVAKQIEILNTSFRRRNADTALIPSYFKSLAADCEIEFQLAVSDPKRRNTDGIVRKYTPIIEWQADDNMKFSSLMGDDSWDPKSYLNIWVCNLQRVAGYASMPGGPESKDGVVISFNVFGPNSVAGFDKGKTAVHEVGHWLNLKHLWGDEYCGDDGVSDTPKQGGYNSGCPTGNHITCENGPLGDMYMNYMDFTNDACIHMFTIGQKNRMRALFAPGGARASLLSSTGLQQPLIFESPLPPELPRWLQPQLYPNPTSSQMTLDLAYDVRWLGKTLTIVNMQGIEVMKVLIESKIQPINCSQLQAGIYILIGKKEDGERVQQKFVKL